jgi:hypothetical protein
VSLAAVTVAFNRQSQPPTSDPEIVTDRPDITESAIVVPKGSLQFESGLTWTSDEPRLRSVHQVSCSKDLNEGWSIGGMESLFWYMEDCRRNLTGESTFYTEKQLTQTLGCIRRVRGRFCSARWVERVRPLWDSVQDHSEESSRFPFWLRPLSHNTQPVLFRGLFVSNRQVESAIVLLERHCRLPVRLTLPYQIAFRIDHPGGGWA